MLLSSSRKILRLYCNTNLRTYSSGVIENIKVLDLTRIVAGPYCTMILGDLGAEVIKIEQPGIGDESRRWPPYTPDKEFTCYFACLNRNKKSICIDLKSPEGREVIHELAKKSDVLVENYVPGKLDTMGLGYDSLKSVAPQLVYCSLTGYGSKGPYKNKPGYDVIAASVGGLLHITGPRNGEPCKTGVAMTDIATGLYAYGAIVTALLERTKTNKGQKIDCNLLSTQVACLINIGSNYLNANIEGSRWGTAHESIVPYEAFKTADGYVTVGTGSNAQFASLCKKLNIEHVINDERFLNNELRIKNREALISLLKPYFLSQTSSSVLKLFEGATFPYGPVNTISQVFEDPHIKEIGLVKEVPLGEDKIQSLRFVGPAVEFSDLQNYIRSPPPKLGQDTKEILKNFLNYSDSKIEALLKKNCIQ